MKQQFIFILLAIILVSIVECDNQITYLKANPIQINEELESDSQIANLTQLIYSLLVNITDINLSQIQINTVQLQENNNNNNDEAGLVNKKRKSEDSGSESGAYTDSDDDQNNDNNHHKKKKNKRTNNSNNSVVTVKHDLHKTSSIFMRNLAPSVTKQDLELLCKSYDGFKRVALSDPGPERGFFRRGWITFESSVDVKKICWSLQNTKIKDFNPGAIVNRELTNRIRPIPNLVSHHKSVIKNDIKLAMKIVQSMDKRWNLWQDNDNDLDESLEKQQTTTTTTTTEQQQTTTEATDSTNPATNTTEGGQTVDSESKETANLEKEAFSKLESMGVKYLTNKFKGIYYFFFYDRKIRTRRFSQNSLIIFSTSSTLLNPLNSSMFKM